MATEAQKLANRRNAQKSTGPRGERSKINQFELIMQNKPNLLNAQMNVTSFYTVDYENKPIGNLVKTNPIQTQYKAKTNPIPEMSKMNVTSILTKDYENETAFRPQKNKPNSNPIKPNLW